MPLTRKQIDQRVDQFINNQWNRFVTAYEKAKSRGRVFHTSFTFDITNRPKNGDPAVMTDTDLDRKRDSEIPWRRLINEDNVTLPDLYFLVKLNEYKSPREEGFFVEVIVDYNDNTFLNQYVYSPSRGRIERGWRRTIVEKEQLTR